MYIWFRGSRREYNTFTKGLRFSTSYDVNFGNVIYTRVDSTASRCLLEVPVSPYYYNSGRGANMIRLHLSTSN